MLGKNASTAAFKTSFSLLGSTFFVVSVVLVFDDVELGASVGVVRTEAGLDVTASTAMYVLHLEELINAGHR
jgi:hypothetical protein